MKQALVSISCITYNHQDFIEECLNGFFMQQCDFGVELVISDDKSTDETVKLIERCLHRKPDNFTIRFTAHETNMGASPNFVWCMQQCTGKYIALCEGDDYWTDPHKLQKQVDFLEENEEYSVVGHNRHILKEGTLTESFGGEYVFTQCMMFRRELLKDDFFKYFEGVYSGDTFLYYYLLFKGKSVSLDFFGAVYRITGKGVYTSLQSEKQKYIHSVNTSIKLYRLSLNPVYDNNPRVKSVIYQHLTNYLFTLWRIMLKEKDFKGLIYYTALIIKYVGPKTLCKKLISKLRRKLIGQSYSI